jgi:hypothetical protein
MKLFRFFTLFFLLAALAGCGKTTQAIPDVWQVKPLEDFIADGLPDEWSEIPVQKLWADQTGRYAHPSDLEALLRIGLTPGGLALFIEVQDDVHLPDTLNPWDGDALEIYLAPFRGSDDIVQLCMVMRPDGSLHQKIYDHRKTPSLPPVMPFSEAIARKEGSTLRYEFLIPSGLLNGGDKLTALQVYVDDSDRRRDPARNVLQWHPLGHSYSSSFAMWEIRPAVERASWMKGASRLKITDNRKTELFVFGTVKGDVIEVTSPRGLLMTKASVSAEAHVPEYYDLSEADLNLETDSLEVLINGETVGFHDLWIAPRVYVDSIQKPFEREIRHFVMQDRILPPPSGAVLFFGSSSIRRWYSLRNDFPELPVIHRGFGGSTSEDALLYLKQIVLPYKPAAIVYYEGDNDIVKGFSPEYIAANVDTFIRRVRAENQGVQIYLVSPKPSIARMRLWPKYQQTHTALKALSNRYEGIRFVDVSTPMFAADGKLKQELFVGDGIHLNEAGYGIWTKVLREEPGFLPSE